MSGVPPLRVVIAEDAALMREGLIRLLEDRGHQVSAAVADGNALLGAVAEHHPDVAVVDIRMPPTHTDEGLRAALELRRRHPQTGVLVLSQYIETRYSAQLLGAGRHARGLATLTPREREVLALMAEGRSNAGIAAALVVSDGAVEKHVASIFGKLGLPPSEGDNRRVLAVLRFLSR